MLHRNLKEDHHLSLKGVSFLNGKCNLTIQTPISKRNEHLETDA